MLTVVSLFWRLSVCRQTVASHDGSGRSDQSKHRVEILFSLRVEVVFSLKETGKHTWRTIAQEYLPQQGTDTA